MHNRWPSWCVIALVFISLIIPPYAQTARAQDVSRTEIVDLDPITVTALRTEQDVQKAPSVAVLTQAQLQNITTVRELTEASPTVQVSETAGPYKVVCEQAICTFAANYFGEASIALNYNEVYVPRPLAFSGMFFDLQRIEIVSGPQGTLYGRNATGGAINVIPRRPEFTTGGTLNVDFGNYGKRAIDAVMNIPLSDVTALRFAAASLDRDPLYDDGTEDEEVRAGRFSLRTELLGAQVDLVADYAMQGGTGGGSTPVNPDGTLPDDPWVGLLSNPQIIRSGPPLNTAFPPPAASDLYQDNEFYGAAAHFVWKGDYGSITAIPAYRGVKSDFFNVAGGFFVKEAADSDQGTLELRYATPSEKRLRAIIGLYTFREEINDGNASFDQSAQGTSVQTADLETESYAGFARLTFSLTPALRLISGARYTYEQKTVDLTTGIVRPRYVPPAPPLAAAIPILSLQNSVNSYDAVTPLASIEFDANGNMLFFLKYEEGFRAGGQFSGPFGANTFDPEYVKSLAAGLKSTLLDNRLRFNVEAFYLDFKDQQVQHLGTRIGPGGTTPLVVQVVENAGQMTSQGVEMQVEFAATGTTTASIAAQYLDAKYDSLRFQTPALGPTPPPYGCPFTLAAGTYTVDCSGKPATQAPKWTTNVSIEQRFPLSNGSTLFAQADSRYQSERETRINYLTQTRADDYTRSNLTLGIRSVKWGLAAYCDNIENKAVASTTFVHASFPSVNLVTAAVSEPRTYGVRGYVSF